MATSAASSSSSSGSSSQFFIADHVACVLDKRRSVCQIIESSSLATGLLVTRKIVIVSAHALESVEQARRTHASFGISEKERVLIRLNPDQDRGGCFYSCPAKNRDTGLTEFSSRQLDFTLVSLDENDPNFKKLGKVAVSLFKAPTPQRKQPVYLLQHPTLDEDPSTGETIVLSDEMRIASGEISYVDCSREIFCIDPFVIHYKIKASHGSSGGPLFNGEGSVIGLHHGECEEHEECKLAVRIDKIEQYILESMPLVEKALLFQDDPIASLKSFYSLMNEIDLLMGGKLSIEAHYTSLAMITDKERKEKQEDLKKPDARLPTYETIFQPKEPIRLEDLFNREELQKADKKGVLTQGSAGIGKSTVCKRIAYQWAQGRLWPQFKVVIWMKFRNLSEKNYPNRPDLYEVIANECSLEPSIVQLLKEEKFRKDCLVILDGYDERPDEKLEFKIFGKGNFPIFEAFQKEFPHMIVTTRPQSRPRFEKGLELEILGFEDPAIDEYVEKFFSFKEKDPEKEKKTEGKKILQNQLQNPLVRSLCHIPINLEIFCSLALEGRTFPMDQPLGIAQIYDRLTDWLMRRFFLLKTDIQEEDVWAPLPQEREEITSAMQALQELAWKGLVENRLYFKNTEDDPEITKAFRLHKLNTTDVTKIGPFRINDGEGQFIHLTFQEFFGAKYLVRLLEAGRGEVKQIVAEKKFDPRYQLVFSMVSGLLAKENKLLLEFFNMLYDSPRDLGKSRETILFARYFEECGNYAQNIPQYKEFIAGAVNLLQDASIVYNIKLELLNKNNFLLVNNDVVGFFIKKLKVPTVKFLHFVIDLCRQKNCLSEKVLTEQSLKRLIDLLSNSNFAYGPHKQAAILALGEIARAGGTLPEEALEELILNLRYEAFLFGQVAVVALEGVAQAGGVHSEKALNTLIKVLSDAKVDAHARRRVPTALLKVVQSREVHSKKALDALIAFFSHPIDIYVHEQVAEALGEVVRSREVNSEEALNKLVDFLACSKADVDARGKVAAVLGEIVSSGMTLPEKALEALIAFLSGSLNADRYGYERGRAVEPLKEIVRAGGSYSKRALDGLIDVFSDSTADTHVGEKIARFLGETARGEGSHSERALDTLNMVLSNTKTDTKVRIQIVKILGEIAREGGSHSEKVLDTLIVLLDSNFAAHAYVHRAAIKALGKVAFSGRAFSEKALAALVAVLSNANTNADMATEKAAWALGAIARAGGSHSERAITMLIDLFSHSNVDAHATIRMAKILGTIVQAGGVYSERALAALIALFWDSQSPVHVRMQVTEILGAIAEVEGSHSEQAFATLITFFSAATSDTDEYAYAAKILKQIIKEKKVDSKQMQRIIRSLDTKTWNEEYSSTVELLEEIVRAKEPAVRNIAMKFLKIIESRSEVREKFSEYIERFLVTFLKSFPIEEEGDKGTLKRVCEKSGIALYEVNGQCYVSGKSLSSAYS